MLQPANRLRRQADFRRTYAQGRTVASPNLVVKYRYGAAPTLRIGVVVGSKVSKQAVERNLVRRRIREYLRQSLTVVPGILDLIIIAKPQAKGKNYETLSREIYELFEQIKGRIKRTAKN